MLDAPAALLAVAAGTAALTLAAAASARKVALARRLLPAVRLRDSHVSPTPRVGGVAMLAGSGAALLLTGLIAPATYAVGGRPDLFGVSGPIWGVGAGLLVILIFGLLDDLRGLPPAVQLLGQALAAGCLLADGFAVPHLRIPLIGLVALSPLVSAGFVLLWTVSLINVINFFDGLDGLAGSIAATAAVIMLLLSLRVGAPAAALLAAITAGAAAGFLPLNWHPAKIFMGTVGSQLLGFLLAATALLSAAKVATAVLVLGVPIFDAAIVVGRRLATGRSPFAADRTHLHHRLLDAGLPTRGVVLLTTAVAAVFGSLALGTQQAERKGLLLGVLLSAGAAFLVGTWYLARRRTRERSR